MQSFKPWHYVLFAAAAVAVVFASMRLMGATDGMPAQAGEMTLVDVETGDLFKISTKKTGIVIPAPHPDSGKYVLYPVSHADGVWKLRAKDIAAMQTKDSTGKIADFSKDVVNVSTGLVAVKAGSPRFFDQVDAIKKAAAARK